MQTTATLLIAAPADNVPELDCSIVAFNEPAQPPNVAIIWSGRAEKKSQSGQGVSQVRTAYFLPKYSTCTVVFSVKFQLSFGKTPDISVKLRFVVPGMEEREC